MYQKGHSVQPILETKRLTLRAFTIEDAQRVQLLAGSDKIADVTSNIPHPYPDGLAEEWILSHKPEWNEGKSAIYAITIKPTGEVAGAISIISIENGQGIVGYWLGDEYWNKDICTEACKELVKFGFNKLGLTRLRADHLSRNPASGRVLQKSGFVHIGENTAVCGFHRNNERIELYEYTDA